MSGDVKEPELELAKKFNERYYHWEEMRYRIEDVEARKRVWFLMKLTRMTNSERLRIGGVECSYSLTSNILRSLFELERALSGHLEYHGKEIGGERMRYYQVSSFVEEAISSSILEGAAVTRADAKQMIRKKRRPVTEGERMVMNNYLAMENIKRIKDEELTPKLIKDMHRIISCGTLKEGEEWEGMFREEDDIVVGDGLEMDKVFHVPPSHGKVPRMIEGLCDFCNMESGEFIPPIVKGIILHFMIGYIHPFVDGNGRLARSLFYWYAIKKWYWIMEYAAISKVIKSAPSKYGMAYQYAETDENDLTYFIKFNVEFIMRAVKELEQHVESKVKKQKEARLFVIQNPQFNMRQAAILSDYMKDDAPFTVVELQRRYRCAYQTMRLDVMALEDLGLIRAVGKVRKAVKYIVDTDKMYEFAVQKDQKMQKNTTDKTKTAGTERNTRSKIADLGR
jgi:Fic family protein